MKPKSKQTFIFIERTRGVGMPNYLSLFSRGENTSTGKSFLVNFQGLLVTDVIEEITGSESTSGKVINVENRARCMIEGTNISQTLMNFEL